MEVLQNVTRNSVEVLWKVPLLEARYSEPGGHNSTHLTTVSLPDRLVRLSARISARGWSVSGPLEHTASWVSIQLRSSLTLPLPPSLPSATASIQLGKHSASNSHLFNSITAMLLKKKKLYIYWLLYVAVLP